MKLDAELKVPGGKLVRVELDVEDGRLRDVKITGDFFLYPEEAIEGLESALRGLSVDSDFEAVVTQRLRELGAELLGAAPSDIAAAIRRALSPLRPPA